MMHAKKYFLAMLILLTLTGTASAATYYLDAEKGNDSNPGTEAQPWKTLARAYDSNTLTPNVEPGDTVYLRNGNYGKYTESLRADRSNWITYKTATGHTPVFTGIFVDNSTQRDTYLKFDGIKVQQPAPDPMPSDDGVSYSTGVIVVRIKYARYVDIRNGVISGFNKYLVQQLLDVRNSQYVNIYHNDMSIARAGMDFVGCADCNFTYNYLHYLSEGSVLGVDGTTGNNNLFEGNHIYKATRNASDPYFPSPTILKVYNTYDLSNLNVGDILTQPTAAKPPTAIVKKVTKSGNVYSVYYRHTQDPSGSFDVNKTVYAQQAGISFIPYSFPEQWHSGSGFAVRSSNLTIRNNIFHYLQLPQGLMFYGERGAYHDIIFENNLFYDVQEVKFYHSGENILIRNNTFVGGIVRYTTRYDEMHKVNITNRYWAPVPTLSMYAGYDGNGIALYNNIGIGYWSLPDPTDPNLLYLENYNIIWAKLGGTNNTKGANTKIVVWVVSKMLHGWPNYFEDIGYRGSTPEYNYTTDGIQPFFVNPGFYFGTVLRQGQYSDKGITWDYHLAPGSPGINFGASTVATYAEVLSGAVVGPSQPPDSLGSIGPDGFIIDNGPPRDSTHHSAGAYEFSDSTPACTNGQTRQCGTTDAGECSYGIQTCSNGTWGSCIGTANPTTEICDNKDNDCDGQTDEENICCPDYALETIANGNCSDAKDNDCDTKTDAADEECQTAECTQDSDCPTGQTCQNSVCAAECIDEVKLLSNISEWKQGRMTMLALMQKLRQWKTGAGC